jgi:hypothetical protein
VEEAIVPFLEDIAMTIQASAAENQVAEASYELIRTIALSVGALAALIGAIGAWFIPSRLAKSASIREKRDATLTLVREIKSSDPVLERLSRLYSYRKWNQGASGYKNPYEHSHYKYEHDAISILNYFEAVCAEIEYGYVEKNILKETSKDMIVGAYLLIQEIDELFEEDQKDSYPFLVKLGQEWEPLVPEDELRIPEIKKDKKSKSK